MWIGVTVMKKRVLSILLIISLASSFILFSPTAAGFDGTLRFNSDGSFKILVFADCQDTDNPYQKMLDFMAFALEYEHPDLVVFTGDNVVVSSNSAFKTACEKLLAPINAYGVPFAYCFGNHDAEKISKSYMHSVYAQSPWCLSYNADDSIFGYANCNLPIYSSTGSSIAFNLWMIDSNMYPSSGSGYDNVHQDQLDWIVRTDNALTASVGHKVDSIVFQHIVVPEVYNCLVESSSGSKTYNGKRYALQLNSNASGYLGEFPCPPNTNSGEFTVLKNMGNVLGIVTGHDHSNSFVGHWQGIDFIQMPGMTFHSYGDSNCRGYGIVELNENDTSVYSSHTVKYTDRDRLLIESYSGVQDRYFSRETGTEYISDIDIGSASSSSTAKSNLTSKGFTVLDFDLNKDAGGNYIYLGYKTTTDYSQAIKDIRVYSDASDTDVTEFNLSINGTPCRYYRCGSDLNKESGGDYIYLYSCKDPLAGAGINALTASQSASDVYGSLGYLAAPEIPAELNKGTTKHNGDVYLHAVRNAQDITSYVNDLKADMTTFDEIISHIDRFAEPGRTGFLDAYGAADSFLRTIETERATLKSTSAIEALVSDILSASVLLTTVETSGWLMSAAGLSFDKEANAPLFNTPYVTVNVSHNEAYPSARFVGTDCTVSLNSPSAGYSYITVLKGDVNGDGYHDSVDAYYVRLITTGALDPAYLSPAQRLAADCNRDGSITDGDAVILERAGLLLQTVDLTLSEQSLLIDPGFEAYLAAVDQSLEIDGDPTDDPAPSFGERVLRAVRCVLDQIHRIMSMIFNFVMGKAV